MEVQISGGCAESELSVHRNQSNNSSHSFQLVVDNSTADEVISGKFSVDANEDILPETSNTLLLSAASVGVSNENVRNVSILMTIFAISIIAIMILIIIFDDNGVHAGWIAVSGAALVFGSTGIPMKTPILASIQLDSLVFAMFTTVGIIITTIPLLVYLIVTSKFIFQSWAILGAVDIVLISYFAYNAVQALGYAIAPAIWAGIGMAVAFLWGLFVFEETPHSPALAGIAIVLLILGVVFISVSSNMKNITSTPSSEGDHDTAMILDRKSSGNNDDDTNNDNRSCQRNVYHMLPAYLLCVITGVCDGSLAVPFKLTSATTTTASRNLDITFTYLASFGISSSFVSPVLFALYCLVVKRGRVPAFHIASSAVPGVLSGMLWASGNFLAIHATHYLGLKIGFPLTQTCVLVTAMWGIFYFREVDIRNIRFLSLFVPGIVCIVAGAYLLGSFG